MELSKPTLNGEEGDLKTETQITFAWVFKRILILLHPVTPFISEELWQKFHPNDGLLINANWDEINITANKDSYERIEWALQAIGSIRSARSRLNIAASLRLPLKIVNLSSDKSDWLDDVRVMLESMARVNDIEICDEYKGAAIRLPIQEATFTIPAEGVLDIEAERKRLQLSVDKQQAEIKKLSSKLDNESFTSKAPEKVIAEVREKLAAATGVLDSLRNAESMLEN